MRRVMTLPEAPERPPATRTPSNFWLVPGLTALLCSLALYEAYVRAYPKALWGALDLRVYLGAGDAVRHGLNPYHLGFTARGLPYTYPPVTLPFSAALSTLSLDNAHRVMEVASLVAAGLVAWYSMGLLGYRRSAGRLGLAAAALAGAVWLEPFQQNANLGQINVILMALVVVDLAQPDTRRWKGIGVGLAAGAKLVPGIFIVYLLLTRRFRAALVALGTFVATVLVGLAAYPHASVTYWGGQFMDTGRVATIAGIGYIGNQSLHGALWRTGIHPNLVFYPLAALLLAGGLLLAAFAARRGGELLGLLTTALTALLVSPIAWSHHWVWVMPILMYAWATAARLAGRARIAVSVVAAGLTVLFSAWPYHLGGPTGPFVPYGVLWALHAHQGGLMSVGPVKHLVWESYTLVGLALLAALAGWLWWGRRAGTGVGGAGTDGGRAVTISSRSAPGGADGSAPAPEDLPLSQA